MRGGRARPRKRTGAGGAEQQSARPRRRQWAERGTVDPEHIASDVRHKRQKRHVLVACRFRANALISSVVIMVQLIQFVSTRRANIA
jgi:hypothetical protein